MSWKERFRKLANQKDDGEKAQQETEKRQKKEKEGREQQVIQNYGPRMLNICEPFAKAMKWYFNHYNYAFIIKPFGKDSDDKIQVEIQPTSNCFVVESNYYFGLEKQKRIREQYKRFISVNLDWLHPFRDNPGFLERADPAIREVYMKISRKEEETVRLVIPLDMFTEELLAEILEHFI